MAPQQGDYTGGDAPLVPGVLTAYRHFYIRSHRATDRFSYGWGPQSRIKQVTPSLISMNGRDTSYSESAVPPPYTASCNKRTGSSIFGALDDGVPAGHTAPHVNCTCGFYAHYDPATDFYPGMAWADPTMGDALATLDFLDALAMNPKRNSPAMMNIAYVEPHVTVRTVVEVSGQVVMGSLGVRAQKMKIVAMAVDWDKYLSTKAERRLVPNEIDITSFGDPYRKFMMEEFETEVVEVSCIGDPSAADREKYEKVASRCAALYGARYYRSVEEMYAQHPKSDIAALGVEEKTQAQAEADRKKAAYSTRYGLGGPVLQPAQLQGMARSFKQATIGFQSQMNAYRDMINSLKSGLWSTPGPSGGKITPGAKTVPKVNLKKKSAFEKALEAKKNKPAPPGCGIDWKGKKP